MAVPAVTPLPASAEPQVFMGVAGENGYMVMGSDGRVHYTISNDGRPYYYYGYCRHHHRHHRCRYVPRPRHHKPKPPKHKHKKHKKDRGKHRGTTTAVTTITTIDPGQESGKRLNPTNRTISPLPRELSAPIPGEQFSCYIPSLPKSPNRAFSKGSPVATSGGGCLYMSPLRRLSRICFSYRLSA